jgi:hypothetical protein
VEEGLCSGKKGTVVDYCGLVHKEVYFVIFYDKAFLG